MSFIEKTRRTLHTFNLSNPDELAAMNELLRNPAAKLLSREIVSQTETHFEDRISTSTTNHIAIVEVEECDF